MRSSPADPHNACGKGKCLVTNTVGQSVRTDMDLNRMWSIQSNYRDARHNIEQLEISGTVHE